MFRHNVSADTDRCFIIKATNSDVYPQASWRSVSERLPIARRSATLDGSVQVRVRSYGRVSDHPHRLTTRRIIYERGDRYS